jgi:predicted deacylase
VLICGTHGVEGSVGAAIQADTLNRLQDSFPIPGNTALLFIFALNPYGFQHHRRCDSDGIDLNRNFIDFTQPLPKNPGYGELMEAVYLPDAERAKRFAHYQKEHGNTAFEIAISGGQYTDSSGPFFGGTAPGHGNRAIELIIAHYQLAGRHLAVVDIHSGLGPYGHGEIICDHLPGTAGFRAAMQWYGPAATAPAEGTSSSVQKEGLLDYRWHALMKERGCFVTLEFGTYPIEALFSTVLNDHRAWKAGDPAEIFQSSEKMREHFCPADPLWRELILIKGRQTVRLALKGLHS